MASSTRRIARASATTDSNSSAAYANSYHSIVDSVGNMILPGPEQVVLRDPK